MEFLPNPTGDMSPPWTVGSSLVPLGSSQVLVLGGGMPHKVGNDGLTQQTLVNWRHWYSRLDQVHLLDLATGSWSKHNTTVLPSGATPVGTHEEHVAEVYLRA